MFKKGLTQQPKEENGCYHISLITKLLGKMWLVHSNFHKEPRPTTLSQILSQQVLPENLFAMYR